MVADPTAAHTLSHGGLRIQVGGIEVVLNADTKRAAAEAFVRASATDPDRPWLVVASQRGNATKVLPGPDAIPVPGWYAYLTRPGTPGQLIWDDRLLAAVHRSLSGRRRPKRSHASLSRYT
jgi:hypothetical protein